MMGDDWSDPEVVMKHYRQFRVRKRSGGYRTISAPDDGLKEKQREILSELEMRVRVSPFAHGFVISKNIMTGALPHIGKAIVINIDVKDFFPSTRQNFVLSELARQIPESDRLYKRVLKYCFVPVNDEKEKDKFHWGLPQGAPTSPFLSNIAMMNIDWRVARYILGHYDDADYTRYADDLTISANDEDVRTVIRVIESYLKHLKMVINRDKLRIMRPHRRQDVCGIVVNEKANLPRKYRKIVRAMLHQNNMTKEAKGHYAHMNSVYGIEYDAEKYKTESIVNTWKVQRRLMEGGNGNDDN